MNSPLIDIIALAPIPLVANLEKLRPPAFGDEAGLDRLFARQWKTGTVPEKWDGCTGERIAAQLELLLG